ncbi:MAG: DUF11 domain-containing protein, partial [Bacteroidetes bacterium]|nr:DUF11 domain-containing protein [Fibrella sp.]
MLWLLLGWFARFPGTGPLGVGTAASVVDRPASKRTEPTLRLMLADDRIDPPDQRPTTPATSETVTSVVSPPMNDQPLLNRFLSILFSLQPNGDWQSGASPVAFSKKAGFCSRLPARPAMALYALALTLIAGLAGSTGAVAQSIDLSVRQVASPKKPTLNAPVGYTIVIKNAGPETATNVVVRDSLPVGGTTVNSVGVVRGTGVSTTSPTDFFDINIPTLAPNDSVVIGLNLTVVGEGVWFNKVEVITAPGTDIDSDPGNRSLIEDDYDATCFAVPLSWYEGDEFTVAIPSGYTDIKWFRNGTLLTVATDSAVVNANNTLTIKGPGTYSFSTTRGGCTTGNCCDIVVVPVASIGDRVFADNNRNGIQDTGDGLLSGVRVTLLSNGSVVTSTVSDVNGVY